MTTVKRWAATALAAATIVASGATGPGSPDDYQQRRERIEKMTPGEKKELLEKKERFFKLSPEKQNELSKLHEDLEKQPNREELEQVMEAYFDWVLTLSPWQRWELEKLPAQERIKKVIEFKKSPGRWSGRRGTFDNFAWVPYGSRGPRRLGPPSFIREIADALKSWAGTYVIAHVDELAALLPPEEQAKWKAEVDKTRSEDAADGKDLWCTLVPWYLAGPKTDLPVTDADITDFGNLLSPNAKKWFDDLAPEERKGDIQQRLRGMLHLQFAFGHPDLKNLVTEDELRELRKQLPPDRQESLAREPEERQNGWLRYYYFLSKLPEHLHGKRDGPFPFIRGGGPGHGDPRRGGPMGGPGRGPGSDRGERFNRPSFGERRPDRPSMPPPPPGERAEAKPE